MTLRNLAAWMVAALVLTTSPVWAEDTVDPAVVERIRANLETAATGMKVDSVMATEMPGVFEVRFDGGPVVYSSASGKHFVLGDMFVVRPEGLVNLGEQRRDGERAAQLEAVARKDMIVFAPKGETRAHITVFTDTTCYYCQKLHQEVPELNRRGVEVRYLAYPRAGLSSPGYSQLASAWCAADRQDTLTRLKNREKVPEKVCKDNPIAAQFRLGQEMGVRGTPAIVTDSGQMIPGYQPADELLATLGLNK